MSVCELVCAGAAGCWLCVSLGCCMSILLGGLVLSQVVCLYVCVWVFVWCVCLHGSMCLLVWEYEFVGVCVCVCVCVGVCVSVCVCG